MSTKPRCPVDLSSGETYFEALPHALLSDLRRSTPVFWHERADGSGYWAILKHADILAISKDNATFSSQLRGVFYEDDQSSLTGSIIVSDAPRHGEMRAVVDPPFGLAHLRRFTPFLREKAREIVTSALDRPSCDFVYDLAAKLPLAAIGEIMQVPEDQRAELLELGDDVIRASSHPQRNAALAGLGQFGKRLAAARSPASIAEGDDIVSRMLRGGADGRPLTDVEFGSQFAQLAVAGNETTRTLLSNICLLLIERPALLAELAADVANLPVAIEEFLRWITPIYYMKRTARHDTVIRGQPIRAGEAVVMYYLSGNRDEEVFDRPFELDIRRKPNRHLSFGVGAHVCLGQFLARIETRLFLEEFVTRVTSVEADGAPVRLVSNITNSWDRIPVRLKG